MQINVNMIYKSDVDVQNLFSERLNSLSELSDFMNFVGMHLHNEGPIKVFINGEKYAFKTVTTELVKSDHHSEMNVTVEMQDYICAQAAYEKELNKYKEGRETGNSLFQILTASHPRPDDEDLN